MKALNLHAVGDLRYEDVPMPVRQAGEVLLKVHACGICGSDLPRVFTKGTYEEAAMCEPAAVALHAIGQASVGIGDTVAVFGAGPIGIMLGLWARTAGAFRVILCDIDPTKVEFARKQGFDAVNSRETDPVEYIRTQTGGRGADACIEGAGVAQTWEQALKAVKSFGTVVSMGNPAGDMTLTQKGYWEILRKQLTLKGTWNSSSEADKAFGVMRERKEFFNKVMFINR